MLQIFPKLQCLTDTLILIMISTLLVGLPTINRSNDNSSLACNRPFQLSTFAATATRLLVRYPSALEGGCTLRKFGNSNDLLGGWKTNICDFLRSCVPRTIVDISESSFLLSFETFHVPDFNHAVIISESNLTSFLRTWVWGTLVKCTCVFAEDYSLQEKFAGVCKCVNIYCHTCTDFAKDIDYQVIFG